MAGAGYKLFSTGDVLSASDVNTYLMQQTVMSFASSAARTTALASVLAEGMVTYLQDTNVVEIYTGASWVSLDDPNAIQNSIADAKVDIITATADNTPARLAVGTNGQTLVADSSTATGLKWAAASSGALTLITTQTFSAAASQSVNTCFSSTYTNYKIIVTLTTASADAMVSLNLRTGSTDTSSTQNYSYYSGWSTQPGSINNVANGGVTSLQLFQTDSGYTAPAYAMSMDMYNPNVSSNTTSTWNAQYAQSSNSWLAAVVGGSFTNTTDQFDGFTLKISAGTMSGKAWVYGYSN